MEEYSKINNIGCRIVGWREGERAEEGGKNGEEWEGGRENKRDTGRKVGKEGEKGRSNGEEVRRNGRTEEELGKERGK
jgi:hypothetical protein